MSLKGEHAMSLVKRTPSHNIRPALLLSLALAAVSHGATGYDEWPGSDVSAPASQAPASASRQERAKAEDFSTFDQVDAKGSNLRQVLAAHPQIVSVLPFGPRVTFIDTVSHRSSLNHDHPIMHPRLARAFYRLCRTQWLLGDYDYDIMTGKVTTRWINVPHEKLKESPSLVHVRSVTHPEYKAKTWLTGASCEGAFEWKPQVVIPRPGSSQIWPDVLGYGVIHHETDQPYITKLVNMALPDTLPQDGIVSYGFFGEFYRKREMYPDGQAVVAWAFNACQKEEGRLIMAYQYAGGNVIVSDPLDMIWKAAGEYYLSCDRSKRGQGFLIRIFRLPGQGSKIALQRGRTLESVGIRQ
jgi:hypothetical protein